MSAGSPRSGERERPIRNVHYEGRDLRERLTACVEMWQSTGPKQQSTRDLLTDLIGVLGEYDPDSLSDICPRCNRPRDPRNCDGSC